MLLYVHRNCQAYEGRPGTAQDGHLDFHTAPELELERSRVQCCFTSASLINLAVSIRFMRDGREPRTATSTLTAPEP